jgi:hypothetical protein
MRERSSRSRARRAGLRAWVAVFTLSAVLGCATPARAEHPVVKGTGMAFDLIIVRPLGLGELLFGFVCFAPMALFAGQSISDPWDHFVVEPYEATFKRPLGDFDDDF